MHVLIIEISTFVFGITALIIASRARIRLTPGLIRQYVDNFSVCLAFIVIFSLWTLIKDFATLSETHEGGFVVPEMFFIIGMYIAFIIASYRVIRISHEFGFKEDSKAIVDLVKKGKKK